ncbi:MAG: hypothetical protein QNJ31_09590 [Candidatus Caenarcaniphilales bacterium]|nr:hypothetical protein [Candidatus Caenarcaniphilales bacterium]
MGYFEEIVKILNSPSTERWASFNRLLKKIEKKEPLLIKNLLDQLQEELREIRLENAEINKNCEEIISEIKALQKEKETLTEKAVEAEINVFREIQIALEEIKKNQISLNKELEDLGEADEDNEIDLQKISTYCENTGNPNSLIDIWGSAVYKVKVLLANKLNQ